MLNGPGGEEIKDVSDAAPEPARVEAALEEILAWGEIGRSPKLGQFLSYIVRLKLAGEEASIKAYSIAVDVFGRPASFDPQRDPIVRVQARRLRSLLERYYQEVGGSHGIRIVLPIGGYVPQFEPMGVVPAGTANLAGWDDAPDGPPVLPVADLRQGEPREARAAAAGKASGSFPLRIAAIAVFVLLTLASIMLFRPWEQGERAGAAAMVPLPPQLVIEEMEGVTQGLQRPRYEGLAIELVTDLQEFGDIEVSYAPRSMSTEIDLRPDLGSPGFRLEGKVEVEGDEAHYKFALTASDGDTPIWTYTHSASVAETFVRLALDRFSRYVALRLGSPRGPLHAEAREWAESNAEFTPERVSPYVCKMVFELYRDSGFQRDASNTRNCIGFLPEDQQEYPVMLAISGALYADEVARSGDDASENAELLNKADRLLSTAVSADPLNSFVWEQIARLCDIRGDVEAAKAAFAHALQLNPANADAIVSMSRMLSLTPDWKEGADLALFALNNSPNPPAWYHLAPALNALRNREFEIALSYAETASIAYPELGAAIALVAAAEIGNQGVIDRYLPEILETASFRRNGILSRLQERVQDPALLNMLSVGLQKAGVPPSAMREAF